jgi:hypothetical protein
MDYTSYTTLTKQALSSRVADILKASGVHEDPLQALLTALNENEIDGASFCSLTEDEIRDDLKQPLGIRKKLWKLINEINSVAPPLPPLLTAASTPETAATSDTQQPQNQNIEDGAANEDTYTHKHIYKSPIMFTHIHAYTMSLISIPFISVVN